jgi:hypothetical protein
VVIAAVRTTRRTASSSRGSFNGSNDLGHTKVHISENVIWLTAAFRYDAYYK